MNHSHSPNCLTQARACKSSKTPIGAVFALLLIMMAACDTSTNQQLATQPQVVANQTDPSQPGHLRLKFGLGPVGILARSMSPPMPDTVHVEIRQKSKPLPASGPADYILNLPLNGKDTAGFELQLDASKSWWLYAWAADQSGEKAYSAGLEINFQLSQVIDTMVVLEALYSEYNLKIPCFDGMTRVVFGIGDPIHFSGITIDSNVASLGYCDTIRFHNRLNTASNGYPYDLGLTIYGDYLGTDQILFQAETTIYVYPGQRQGIGIPLKWKGPTPTLISPMFKIGEIGVEEIEAIYPISPIERRESGVFLDDRYGQRYDFKRFGNQVWMIQNIGAGCDTCDSSGFRFNKEEYMDACPVGWHLPNVAEWQELIRFAANGQPDSVGLYRLRSKYGWTGYTRYSYYDYEKDELFTTRWKYNGSNSLGFYLVPSATQQHGGAQIEGVSTWAGADMWTSSPITPVMTIAENVSFTTIRDSSSFTETLPAYVQPYAVRCIRD